MLLSVRIYESGNNCTFKWQITIHKLQHKQYTRQQFPRQKISIAQLFKRSLKGQRTVLPLEGL